jgi:hypothetical protein
LIEIFQNIPAVIYSVTLGSLIAFLGVLISNRENRKRLEIQLKHDESIKIIERKASMRREVYLNAAEELVKTNHYLGSLTQTDLAKTNLADGLQGFFVSAAKLSLVAEQQTGKALNDLMVAYSALFFRLLEKVSPIHDARSSIDIINNHYEESQNEIKRILTEMTKQNESGAPNEEVFQVLNESFEFHHNRSRELSVERNKCWETVNELTSNFALNVMEEIKEISLLQIPVFVGIRKELDIDTDIESYKAQVLNNAEKIGSQIDEFILGMKNNA